MPFRRSGIYPNGERSQKYRGESVVSERSVRQIDNMIKNKEKYQFAIIFLVNRGDCTVFKPNWQRDPIYSKKLVKAVKNGIDVYALGWIKVENLLYPKRNRELTEIFIF